MSGGADSSERRTSPSVFEFGPFRFDAQSGMLSHGSEEVILAPKPQQVLLCLLEKAGQVVTKEELIERVWPNTFVTDRSLSEAVRTLREKLEDGSHDSVYIQTVHRRGYRFKAVVSVRDERTQPEPSSEEHPSPTPKVMGLETRFHARSAFLGALAVVALIGAASIFIPDANVTPQTPSMAFSIDFPKGGELASLKANRFHPLLDISRDGSAMVYVADNGESTKLYLRRFDEPQAIPIPGTEGGYNPFFSPDGRQVGFFAGLKKKKVSLNGGRPVELVDGAFGFGADWGHENSIVFAALDWQGLWQVSALGGEPSRVWENADAEWTYAWPEYLPDGSILASRFSLPSRMGSVVIFQPGQQAEEMILHDASAAHFVNGYLVFVRDAAIWAVRFDLVDRRTEGLSQLVVEDTLHSAGNAPQFALGQYGKLVYARGTPFLRGGNVVRVDRQGNREPILAGERYSLSIVSPSGRRLALTGPDSFLWIYEVENGRLERVTFDQMSLEPMWGPDETRVAVTSFTGSNLARVIVHDLAKRTSRPSLFDVGISAFAKDWSPHGDFILAEALSGANSGMEIWQVPLNGTPRVVLSLPANGGNPRLSRDGKWIAYQSDETGRHEIYVQPFPELSAKWQITSDGGMWPAWSPDGREILLVRG